MTVRLTFSLTFHFQFRYSLESSSSVFIIVSLSYTCIRYIQCSSEIINHLSSRSVIIQAENHESVRIKQIHNLIRFKLDMKFHI